MSNMNTIEFIGIPGTGKSYIRDKLLNQLNRTSSGKYLTAEDCFLIAAKDNIDKHLRYLIKLLPDFVLSKNFSRIQNRSQWQFDMQNQFIANYAEAFNIFLTSNQYKSLSLNDRKILINYFLDAGSLYQCVEQHCDKETGVLFDEGMLQKSMMFVSLSSNDTDDLQRITSLYLSTIPCSDFIVHVKADIETCHERLKYRSRGLPMRMKSFDDESINEFLSLSSRHFNDISYQLKNNPKHTVLEIDNSDSSLIDHRVEEVVNLINEANPTTK
jgi:shikimate kinase